MWLSRAFLIATLLTPAAAIPRYATAPALIWWRAPMKHPLHKSEWSEFSEAVHAFYTM